MTEERRTKLNEDELDEIAAALAPKLVELVKSQHHNFWIDPQSHYDAHQEIRLIVSDYQSARGVLLKVFLTALAFGSLILAGLSVFYKDGK